MNAPHPLVTKGASEAHIGQVLRECRESLGVTLEAAATALHIRARYLSAIESGALQDLPGKAYVRGYIRNYANFLQLNVPELFASYAAPAVPAAQDFFVPKPSVRQHVPSRVLLLLALLLLFMLYGAWVASAHHESAASLKVDDVPEHLWSEIALYRNAPMAALWQHCLNDGDVTCFLTLALQPDLLPTRIVYDSVFPLGAPQHS